MKKPLIVYLDNVKEILEVFEENNTAASYHIHGGKEAGKHAVVMYDSKAEDADIALATLEMNNLINL